MLPILYLKCIIIIIEQRYTLYVMNAWVPMALLLLTRLTYLSHSRIDDKVSDFTYPHTHRLSESLQFEIYQTQKD